MRGVRNDVNRKLVERRTNNLDVQPGCRYKRQKLAVNFKTQTTAKSKKTNMNTAQLNNITHAGSSPAAGSDQVKALVTDADFLGCGRSQTRLTSGDGPQVALATGMNEESEEQVFGRRASIMRSPPARARSNSTGATLKKRSRPDEEEEDPSELVRSIKMILEAVHDLTRTVKSATNIRRDVVACANSVDIAAQRLANGRLEELVQSLKEERLLKSAKIQAESKKVTCEVGTQCSGPSPVWPKKPSYKYTKVIEGSPLTLDSGWDLAVVRTKADHQMELGIQRLFRNRFGELSEPEGDVIHIKQATWQMGKENEPPTLRYVYRIDDGDKTKMKERFLKVIQKVASDGKARLAVAWDDLMKEDLTTWREVLEEAAASCKVEVSIHTKQTKKAVKPPVRKTSTDAILIKKAEGATYASTLKLVREEEIQKGLTNTVRGVRETKSGDLVLTVEKKAIGTEKADITKALKLKLGSEKVHVAKSKPEAIVHIKDIEVDTTEAEVKSALLQALGGKVAEEAIKIASLRKGFAGTQNATVHLPKVAEEELLRKKTVRIGLPSCRIAKNRQVVTCFKSWLPGHTTARCKGPDRSKACRNCGKEGHERRECKEESSCLICGEKGHPANTTRCKIYKKALEDAKPSKTTGKQGKPEPKIKTAEARTGATPRTKAAEARTAGATPKTKTAETPIKGATPKINKTDNAETPKGSG